MALSELDRVDRAQRAANAPVDDALPVLIELVGDESWRVRNAAVQSLVALRPSSRVAEALIHSLREPEDTGRRNAALTALARLGRDALPGLLGTLADESPHVRKLAADALGLSAEPNAVPALAARLLDTDANVRAAVAEALGRVATPEAVAALRSHLLDVQPADPLEASTVLWSLSRAHVSLPLPSLDTWLKNPMTRAAALSLTTHCKEPEAALSVLQALCSPMPTLRMAAVRALVHAGAGAPVVNALLSDDEERAQVHGAAVGLLNHLDEEVAGGAATVAAWSAQPGTAAALLIHRHGRPWDAAVALAWSKHGRAASVAVAVQLVRMEPEDVALALDLLQGHPDERCAAPLADLASHAHGETLELILSALLACDPHRAIPSMMSRLLDGTLEPDDVTSVERLVLGVALEHAALVRQALRQSATMTAQGARLWAASAAPEDREMLRDLMRSPDAAVRAAACEGLGRAGTRADAEALRPMLLDENARVRAAAARSLGMVGTPSHVSLLEARAQDEDVGVVQAALEAVCKLDETRARALALDKAASPRADVAEAALGVAEVLGGVTALAAGIRALASGDVQVARAGVRALGAARVREAVTLLLPVLSDVRWELRHAVAKALPRLWHHVPPDLPELAQVRQARDLEQDPLVKEALETALEQGAR